MCFLPPECLVKIEETTRVGVGREQPGVKQNQVDLVVEQNSFTQDRMDVLNVSGLNISLQDECISLNGIS